MDKSRLVLSAVCATLVHAAVLWMRAPKPRPVSTEVAPDEIALEIATIEETQNVRENRVNDFGVVAMQTPRAAIRLSSSGSGAIDVGGTAPSGEFSAPAPSGSGEVTSVWNMSTLRTRDLGIADRTFAVPPKVDEEEARRVRSQRILKDPLYDQEVLAGGDPYSGPVVKALQETTRYGIANGRATFEAVINAAGAIVSITLVDVSRDRADWNEIAKTSTETLASRTLRASKKGVVVRVEIVARVQLASGNQAGHPVDMHGPNPDLTFVPDETHANGNGNIVSGTFDVTDIGGRPLRVVSGRATSLRDL